MARITIFQIYNNLPALNCGKCGESSCMAFADKLLNKEAELSSCTPLYDEPEKYRQNIEALESFLSEIEKSEKTGLIVDEDLCIGCGNCVIACPANHLLERETMGGGGPRTDNVILRVEGGKVKVTNLDECRRMGKEKTCRVCVEACPTDAIELL